MKGSPSDKLKFGIDRILGQKDDDERSISFVSRFDPSSSSSSRNECFFLLDGSPVPFFVSRCPSLCWPVSFRPRPSRRGMLRRAVFSEEQRLGLELAFNQHKYIAKPERKQLAQTLALKDTQVRPSLPL